MRTKCEFCGRELRSGEVLQFDGRQFCQSCLDEQTCLCENCGVRMWISSNSGDGNVIICQNCYEYSYTTCESCGRLIPNADAYYFRGGGDPYCESCYDRLDDGTIREYDYKPEAIFYGDGDRYFGVELEIDEGGECGDNAQKLLSAVNCCEERIYCKHDGSLSDGFEIVTHPMSLEYHLSHMPWASILNAAVNMGYISHQATTCGLHVHVNRTSLGLGDNAQENSIARVLYFVEKHWNELLRFSRRSQRQIDNWAARYGYKDHPKEMIEHVKKGSCSRYTCVNLTNSDTIEFRIFRGTLKYNTLIATLQMVDRICDVAVSMSDEGVKALSWSEFVSKITEPELIRYLKERRLYINEPVCGEEEV